MNNNKKKINRKYTHLVLKAVLCNSGIYDRVKETTNTKKKKKKYITLKNLFCNCKPCHNEFYS